MSPSKYTGERYFSWTPIHGERYLDMSTNDMKRTAQEYADALVANTDDLLADRISYETFSERNKVLWAAIQTGGGPNDKVQGILRDLFEQEAGIT
jgi:hypothetical protein